MKEKLMLPKFRVPGQSSRWTTRIAVGVAALVVIQIGVFAAVIWRQRAASAAALADTQREHAGAVKAAPVMAAAEPTSARGAVTGAEAPATGGASDEQGKTATTTTAQAAKVAHSSGRSARYARRSSGKALAKVSVARPTTSAKPEK
jgi:hypothetical protein